MECNRDEAVRAKEIAERKFLANDIKGAKKFAVKARTLYSGIEGISQMVTTFNVYISAEKKINGEYNWYAVLGVTPLADDETVRKQYRKLALLLHPDKNKFVGAEGAFQLVSQAWSLLSDKSKRLAYDQKYGSVFQETNQTTYGGPPTSTMQNGFYNVANTAASQMRVPKGNFSKKDASSGPTPSHQKERRSTFWTVCHRCKVQYEYLRMYLNQHLLCPHCLEAYLATEIEPPSSSHSKSSIRTSVSHVQRRTNQQGLDAAGNKSTTPSRRTAGFDNCNLPNHSNFQQSPFFESNGTTSIAQAANMVQQAYEKVRRERQKAQAATRKEEAMRRKNHSSKRTIDGGSFGHNNMSKRRKGVEDCGTSKAKMKQVNCESRMAGRADFPGGIRNIDIKQLMMVKVQAEIRKKLNELRSESVTNTASGSEGYGNMIKSTANVKGNGDPNSAKLDENKFCEPVKDNSQVHLNGLNFWADMEPAKQISIDVLDSDFHNFGWDRMVRCFRDGQVWAMYDGDDGMPRYYAVIRSVISLNPFKVQISWLNSKANKWFSSGFSKTCGVFGIGRQGISQSVELFSHKVRRMKDTRGTIEIFPQKGDAWALYENWSAEWDELTEYEVIHKYVMVEVLEDYDEELGVIVIPLVKVAGFKAIFHRHLNPSEIRRIPKEEISRFSHQVPSHLLTCQEGSNAPKGCRELDPAATPLELLQVISEIKEIESIENEEEIEIVEVAEIPSNIKKWDETS